MEFKTSDKINKWVEEHKKVCKIKTFDGSQFKYSFIPTTIVECQTVQCLNCKTEFVNYID